MSAPLTAAQREALGALYKAGGSGVITKTGTLLAAGEELHDGDPHNGRFASVTWLRLVAANMIGGDGNGRLHLTTMGVEWARRHG